MMNTEHDRAKRSPLGTAAGWIVVLVGLVWAGGFWLFNYSLTGVLKAPTWDMSDRTMVPGAAMEADGYYVGSPSFAQPAANDEEKGP